MSMILDRELSKIVIEEMTIDDISLMEAVPGTISRYWSADLDGESTDGQTVRMSRNGDSPDSALRALFEAMHNARVTL